MENKSLDKEKLEWINEQLVTKQSYNRDEYPRCFNISQGMYYNQLPVPKERKAAEFIFLKDYFVGKRDLEKEVAIHDWNNTWELGQLRTSFFWDKLPKSLNWLKDHDLENIYLIPDDDVFSYSTYAPLLHLIPFKTRSRHNIPQLRAGVWPFGAAYYERSIGDVFTSSFKDNLSNAFATHIWPLLNRQSKIDAFSHNDPIVLLSHNLKFWLPHVYAVIEEELELFGRVDVESEEQKRTINELQNQYPEIDVKLPLRGGDIWRGEDGAWGISKKIVESADENGQLSNLFDAIKSNRIQDDFSDHWSNAKEDFERKLYRKRSRYRVNFVELNSSIPIQSYSSEIVENELWDDFFSILNHKEKRIVVCLRKGITKHKEISEILGYKNHSPVTKSIKKIREKAEVNLSIKPNKSHV